MSVSAATLRKLIDAGLSGDALIDVVESIEADRASQAPVVDEQAERRRAVDRARKGLTASDKLQILKRDEWECVYCGKKDDAMQVDHIFPISRGGSNDPDNLVAACKSCNLSKGAKTPEEWGGRS